MATARSDPATMLWALRPASRSGAARLPRTVKRKMAGFGSTERVKGKVVMDASFPGGKDSAPSEVRHKNANQKMFKNIFCVQVTLPTRFSETRCDALCRPPQTG